MQFHPQGDIRLPLDTGNDSDGVNAGSKFLILSSPAMLPVLGTKLGRLLGKCASLVLYSR